MDFAVGGLRIDKWDTQNMSERRLQLTTLQAGRAVAAIMVVLFHIEIFIFPDRLYPGSGIFEPFEIGYSGVEFFFALSGFLMAYIHTRHFGQVARAGSYLKKRVGRIYPTYWALFVPLVVLWMVVPGAGPETIGLGQFFYDLSLLPTKGEPMLAVAWTLQFEMFFYVMFMLAILSKRVGVGALALWFGVCFIGLFLPQRPFPLQFLTSEYNLIFLGGMLAAYGFEHMKRVWIWPAFGFGIACFLAVGLADLYGAWPLSVPFRTVFVGAAASLIVASLAAGEAKRGWSAPKFLGAIGDASYSLYLVHMPLMTMGAAVMIKLGINAWMPMPVMLVGLIGGCVIASLIMHHLIEKPLTVWVQHRLQGGQPRITNIAEKLSG
jgi:peptidoglycan/LPS O-acetylase OafA/YrhL